MTLEEAVKAATRMMTAYTTYRATEEALLVLAEVLRQFPLETAMAASSPVHGAPKAYRDHPLNAGQLTDWCEREARTLYDEARHERARLAPPAVERPTADEVNAVLAKHNLSHLRVGSKCDTRQARHSADERREAQAILDRYAAEAQRQPVGEAAE